MDAMPRFTPHRRNPSGWRSAPATPDDPMVQLHFLARASERERIRELADARGVSVSKLLRDAALELSVDALPDVVMQSVRAELASLAVLLGRTAASAESVRDVFSEGTDGYSEFSNLATGLFECVTRVRFLYANVSALAAGSEGNDDES